jgi:hypothetical protein
MTLLTYLFNWFFRVEQESCMDDSIEIINQLFDEAYFSNFPEYVEI